MVINLRVRTYLSNMPFNKIYTWINSWIVCFAIKQLAHITDFLAFHIIVKIIRIQTIQPICLDNLYNRCFALILFNKRGIFLSLKIECLQIIIILKSLRVSTRNNFIIIRTISVSLLHVKLFKIIQIRHFLPIMLFLSYIALCGILQRFGMSITVNLQYKMVLIFLQ